MNKKIKVVTILSIITGLVLLNIITKENTVIKETIEIVKNKNMLTMLLETEAGTGNYEEVKQSEWPQDGYVFNETLSKCENGGTLSWDDSTKKVIMKSNISDKCYVYFDVYVEPTIGQKICNSSGANSLSCYLANSIYTEDGVNGLYYHDGAGTYTNASQEAGDNSYRYSGANYILTANASAYNNVMDTSASANGLIKFYCSDGSNTSYVGRHCSSSSYYYLAYDSSKRYDSTIDAISQALSDGYLASNVNNYICFGSDSAVCPDDNLYRIIGLFDDGKDEIYNIKLIKATVATSAILGENGSYSYYNNIIYYWNNSSGTNNWNESNLNTINLNTNYWNNLGSTWQNLIVTNVWKVGGNTASNLYNTTVKNTYQNEIVNPAVNATYSDEIGLIYVSDYGYATSPENWQTNLEEYDNDAITANNWMYIGDSSEWTITRRSDTTNSGIYIFVNGILTDLTVDSNYGGTTVRPVFYLKPNVTLISGDGSISNPFRVSA